MKEWQEISIAVRKPSTELSKRRPCRSALGAKAIECSRKSSRPQRGSPRRPLPSGPRRAPRAAATALRLIPAPAARHKAAPCRSDSNSPSSTTGTARPRAAPAGAARPPAGPAHDRSPRAIRPPATATGARTPRSCALCLARCRSGRAFASPPTPGRTWGSELRTSVRTALDSGGTILRVDRSGASREHFGSKGFAT
jgi:hypothetical protein